MVEHTIKEVQRILYKPNLIETNFRVRNRQVLDSDRIDEHFIHLEFGLYSNLSYSGFTLDMFHFKTKLGIVNLIKIFRLHGQVGILSLIECFTICQFQQHHAEQFY